MQTNIFEVIDHHNLNRLKEILEQGANPNIFSSDGDTPLIYSICELEFGGSDDMIDVLLKYGADINGWDSAENVTPLIMALFNEEYEIVPKLVDAGADPNVSSGEGHSPLRLLVDGNKLELVELLLSRGGKKTVDSPGAPDGLTPLGMASKQLNLPMVELLLENGANSRYLDDYINLPYEIMPARNSGNREVWNKIMKILKKND